VAARPTETGPPDSASAGAASVLLPALQPPVSRRGTVVRRALLDRLADDTPAKLVLVAAPAGWGKTSLLRDWCASGDGPRTAWLSLGQGDNDPARFWTGVIAALRTVGPGIGADTLPVLKAPGRKTAGSLLTPVINDLARLPERLTLVIDDFHLITSEPIAEHFRFLVDHLPRTLGLVVATRTDPTALPLARMRARGELAEFRTDDLRFTETETERLLNGTLRLALPACDVRALHQRTEGWAAGLYLAGLSLRGREDRGRLIGELTGGSRPIVDYFAAEVLAGLPSRTRSFLARTSVLDRFSGPLCDMVTGAGGSQGLLEELERIQLFLVPLDTTRHWYRYHTLFAELLRHELDKSEPGLARVLHRRASAWHRQHGAVTDAVEHALLAQDYAGARDLIAARWQPLLNEGLTETVDAWLGRLPPAMITEDSRMCLVKAWLARFLGRIDEVEPWLAAVEATGPAGPVTGGPRSAESAAAMLRAQSCHMTGDLVAAEAAGRRAVELEADGTPRWHAAAQALLAVSLFWLGRDDEAGPLFERVTDPTRPPASNLASLWALGCMAAIAARDGDRDACERRLAEADDLAAAHDIGGYWMTATALTVSAGLLADRGQPGAARRLANQALDLARRGRARPETAHALLCLARISAGAGDTDGARAHTDEASKVISAFTSQGFLSGLRTEVAGLTDPVHARTGRADGLSAREAEVLTLVAEGHTNGEIAAELVLSVHTIERHLQNAYRKIGVRNRADAAAYMVRHASG
jgi:LuxR family transcriptional regulator, maltose regulon positive regulatory protein